ncbi:MAG: zinc ribbon domain-containing protein [Clostridiaceae bacterium]|nr:zinc ribbon domain-containing protein [Clostridiaceae bacterium]
MGLDRIKEVFAVFCRHCGRQLMPGSRYCHFCGNLVTRQKKKWPNELLAALAIYLAVALVLGTLAIADVFKPHATEHTHASRETQNTVLPSSSLSSSLPYRDTGQRLKLGRSVKLLEQDVLSSGATLTVSDADHALTGLEIKVPAGSYPDTIHFTVTEITVLANGLDRDLILLTPLLQVENGGAYASGLVTVRLPCQVPDDHLAVGFYYDLETDDIECVSVMSQDSTSVTLGVRHFSGIGVGAVPEAVISVDADTGYETDFVPGIDDFNMANNGSSLEPDGYCAGQCLAMMWYYKQRKKAGEPALWNRYDNYGPEPALPFLTPARQDDDVMALRLASVAQHNITWTSTLLRSFIDVSKLSDKQTFLGIIYAMRLHKSPQLICLYELDDTGTVISGHAIIAYKWEGNRIYVADPNHPGRTDRLIELKDDKIQPYASAATASDAAAGKGRLYTQFSLVGFTALHDQREMAELWRQLDARTVGSRAFPASGLKLFTTEMTPEGEKHVEITSGYEAKNPTLEITYASADSPTTYYLTHATPAGVCTPINKDIWGMFAVNLKLGDNYLGIKEMKTVGGKLRWHDYRWIKVVLPFPYTGRWQGTLHFDDVKLPPANPDASTAMPATPREALSIGCDQIPLELLQQLLALKGTSQGIEMAIAESNGQYKAVFCMAGATLQDPLTSADRILLTPGDNCIQGETRIESSNIVIRLRLESDGESADKMKGRLDFITSDGGPHGIFTSITFTRDGD